MNADFRMGQFGFLALMAIVLAALASLTVGATAQSPEAIKQIYTVTGIKVDVREKDAAQAKLKAISDAQLKGFARLTRRLASADAAARMAKLDRRTVGRLMASLSISNEHTAPGRYIATLTVRFLPKKVREVYLQYGVRFIEKQAEKTVILPVWVGTDGPVAWAENPWRQAWLDLKAENALVPIIVPLGDLTDTEAITAEEAVKGHETKLGSIKFRYQAQGILVAVARQKSPTEIHATMTGESPIGRIGFDRVYKAKDGETIEQLAARVAKRFHTVMTDKWKKDGGSPQGPAGPPQSFAVSVPFSTLAEWNNMRIELLTTPGVKDVAVTSISDNGAVIQLTYVGGFDVLQKSLANSRLRLTLYSGQWVLQPF